MQHPRIRGLGSTRARMIALGAALVLLAGCRGGGLRATFWRPLSPVDAGYHTNNLLDLHSQADADALGSINDQTRAAERIRRKPTLEQLAKRRSVLCLSGGGSYGAFTAGVLCGWTAAGDRPGVNGRPNFSVVTGISTGALIAPYAFLGPRYDEAIRRFYTTIEDRDIYRWRPIRGLFSEAIADNTPLANLIDQSLSPQIIQEVGDEHRKGRRLYIGTTELESGRFVCWDVGEIAARNGPGDRELILQILLGSSAIPAFFPPARIPVTVDGQTLVENHGDGGASMPIFFRPPFVSPEERSNGSGRPGGSRSLCDCCGKALRRCSAHPGTFTADRRAEHLHSGLCPDACRAAAALSPERPSRDELPPRRDTAGVSRSGRRCGVRPSRDERDVQGRVRPGGFRRSVAPASTGSGGGRIDAAAQRNEPQSGAARAARVER